MEGFIAIIAVIVFLLIYFLPAMVAFGRNKKNSGAIFLLNIFLGWTLVGRVVALVWASCHD